MLLIVFYWFSKSWFPSSAWEPKSGSSASQFRSRASDPQGWRDKRPPHKTPPRNYRSDSTIQDHFFRRLTSNLFFITHYSKCVYC